MAREAVIGRPVGEKRVSDAVVSTVAQRTGTDPCALEPLYDVVDPDVLDSLFDGKQSQRGPNRGRIEFSYAGCNVVVSADGDVRVSESG